MATKMTSEIDKYILPIVKNTLSKSLTKYKAMMGRFINTRSSSLYDTFPATRMLYGQTDADDLLDVFGMKGKESELQSYINNTYYGQIPNFNPRAAKDPVTVLCMCIIKYFYLKKDKQNLELAMIYLSFSGKLYPSIHYAQYPKAVPADYRFVCDYVVNNELSDKFALKTTGSVIGAMKSINIKSFIKNTAEVYYRCYNNKDYLTYDSDDNSQDNFRLTENDSTKIDAATRRTMTYITSHDVDYRICKMCSDSNIKTEEIKSIIESIVKNTENTEIISELVSTIISVYFESSKTKDVRDIEFISFTIKAKPNTKNKNILRQNEIIEQLLTENSLAYNRRKSRIATRLSYNRAILTYFTLIINQANK